MKGLLKKDFYVLTRQLRAFLVLIAVFAILPGGNLTGFAIVYCSMMPYTSFAFDERSKWDDLAATMPYTVGDLVLSKYVLGWLAMAFASALCLVSNLVLNALIPDYGTSIPIILPAFCMGLLVLDLTLPLMFRFGVERGRIFFVMLIVLACVGGGGLISQAVLQGGTRSPAFLETLITLWLPLAGVVGTVISIPLSMKLYSRRAA